MPTDSAVGWCRAADAFDLTAGIEFHCDGFHKMFARFVLRHLKPADLPVGAGITEAHLSFQLPFPKIIPNDNQDYRKHRG